MTDEVEPCAHPDQEGHRYCNQCGARLFNAATKRESFRDHIEKKS